jgi:hypothetical protein
LRRRAGATVREHQLALSTGNISHIIVTADETWVHSEPETRRQFWNGNVSVQCHDQSVATVQE